jgi:hypothetical protein
MDDVGLVSGSGVFVALLVLGALALSATQRHRATLAFQLRLFALAACLRYALSIVIYQFGLVHVLRDEDSSGWIVGVVFQERWLQGSLEGADPFGMLSYAFQGRHQGYYYLLAALFYVTDAPTRLTAAALNCVIGALTVVFTYRTARVLFPERVAVRAAWWACLFPSLVLWSAQTLKEPVVIFLESLAVYACAVLKRSGMSPRHGALVALVVVVLLPFRFYAAYVVVAAVGLSLLMPRLQGGTHRLGPALTILAVFVPLLLVSGELLQREAGLHRYDLAYLQSFRKNTIEGYGSGVELGFDVNSPDGLAMSVGVGAAYLLFAPFPWQLAGGSLRMLFVTPEILLWYWLFFAGVLPGLVYAVRKRLDDVLPLLLFLAGLGLLYSLIFGNVGLAYRQRAQLLTWLLIFAAVGLERRYGRRRSPGPHELAARPEPVSNAPTGRPVPENPGSAAPPRPAGQAANANR